MLALAARFLGTVDNTPSSDGTPGARGAWNPNCDLNGDNKVDAEDLSIVTANYGKTMG